MIIVSYIINPCNFTVYVLKKKKKKKGEIEDAR